MRHPSAEVQEAAALDLLQTLQSTILGRPSAVEYSTGGGWAGGRTKSGLRTRYHGDRFDLYVG